MAGTSCLLSSSSRPTSSTKSAGLSCPAGLELFFLLALHIPPSLRPPPSSSSPPSGFPHCQCSLLDGLARHDGVWGSPGGQRRVPVGSQAAFSSSSSCPLSSSSLSSLFSHPLCRVHRTEERPCAGPSLTGYPAAAAAAGKSDRRRADACQDCSALQGETLQLIAQLDLPYSFLVIGPTWLPPARCQDVFFSQLPLDCFSFTCLYTDCNELACLPQLISQNDHSTFLSSCRSFPLPLPCPDSSTGFSCSREGPAGAAGVTCCCPTRWLLVMPVALVISSIEPTRPKKSMLDGISQLSASFLLPSSRRILPGVNVSELIACTVSPL
mmetsp:Transcript_18255/g.59954  ORF Transcript_18255/g.59954 Transcript_18255/m.59954 type:complete len:325 (-) Transcript_18255:1596-2570(-)